MTAQTKFIAGALAANFVLFGAILVLAVLAQTFPLFDNESTNTFAVLVFIVFATVGGMAVVEDRITHWWPRH